MHGSVAAGILDAAIVVAINGLYQARAELGDFAPTADWASARGTTLGEPDGAIRWLTKLGATRLVNVVPDRTVDAEVAMALRSSAVESYEQLDAALSTLVASLLVSDVVPIIHEARRLGRKGTPIVGPAPTALLPDRQVAALFGAVERMTSACRLIRVAHR